MSANQIIEEQQAEIERLRAELRKYEGEGEAMAEAAYPECDCGGNMVPVQFWKCTRKHCQHTVSA